MDSGCHKLSENIRFCGLRGHIVEIRRDVTLVDNGRRTTECEDRARILGSRIRKNIRYFINNTGEKTKTCKND